MIFTRELCYPCIDYKIGNYAECVENEMIQKVLSFMNCTPPWMTDNDILWCEGKRDAKTHTEQYFSLLRDKSVSQASAWKCLVPCRMKIYHVKEVGLREIRNICGLRLIIRFDKLALLWREAQLCFP